MREILFRGKRIDDGEWKEGYLFDDGFINSNRRFIGDIVIEDYKGSADDGPVVVTGINFCEINPSTICQHIGLIDKNGRKIFEGDIVKCGRNMVVRYSEKFASWCLTRDGWLYNHYFGESCDSVDCEVIGNIFDNPELLN